EALIRFIEKLKSYLEIDIDYIYYNNKLKRLIFNKEKDKGILSKHFAYNTTIVSFLKSIKYDELKTDLMKMHNDILIDYKKAYFSLKNMNVPLYDYIYKLSIDENSRNKTLKYRLFK